MGTLSDLWNSLDFSAMLSALMRLIAVFLCLTVTERIGRKAVAGLVDRQAEEHRRYTEHRVSQRGNIQRLKQILQIMQHKTLQ